jgi:tRNA U34 5-methylaminomethyl-2-thiouridine-forming methyltransferase MnmC
LNNKFTRHGRFICRGVFSFSFRPANFPRDWNVHSDSRYQLVRLNNGIFSVRSLVDAETFHPVVGPVAEAESLYVNQLQLRERIKNHVGEFVIWDVGLGAAANSLAVLRATRNIASKIRLVSFDHTLEPLEFALRHAAELGYFDGYEIYLKEFLHLHRVTFAVGPQTVNWEFHLGDFPSWLADAKLKIKNSKLVSPPHVILFDAYSPARNPAMWTLPLFTNIFQRLDPQRPCMMPTYSRSTILRTTLLLAGFFVGVGHATGLKEETTIAANQLDLLAEPLGRRWLERARRSHSAEPLAEPVYRIAPLSAESWIKLQAHPQFAL